MYIYYDKFDNIKMISEGKIKADNFKYIKKTLSKTEKEKLLDNKNKRQVVNGKLVITKPISEESLEDRIKILEDKLNK